MECEMKECFLNKDGICKSKTLAFRGATNKYNCGNYHELKKQNENKVESPIPTI